MKKRITINSSNIELFDKKLEQYREKVQDSLIGFADVCECARGWFTGQHLEMELYEGATLSGMVVGMIYALGRAMQSAQMAKLNIEEELDLRKEDALRDDKCINDLTEKLTDAQFNEQAAKIVELERLATVKQDKIWKLEKELSVTEGELNRSKEEIEGHKKAIELLRAVQKANENVAVQAVKQQGQIEAYEAVLAMLFHGGKKLECDSPAP